MVDGRKKGNDYENEIARALTVWLAPEDRRGFFSVCPIAKLWFRRRPADNDNIVTDWVGGRDLIHKPDIRFPFSVELKKQEGWSFDGVFNARWPVSDWWLQAVNQADDLELIPLLIFTRNRMPDFVAVPTGVASCLNLSDESCVILDHPRKSAIIAPLQRLTQVSPFRFQDLKRYLPV